MQKGATLINKACLEGCTRRRCLRLSVREQSMLHLRGATQERRDCRIGSIRVHRTALRHPVVSTSNAKSVEVGEDAFELSCLQRQFDQKEAHLYKFNKQSTKKEM